MASESRSKVPASIRSWASESYSSAEPSHQWMASGWVRSAISPTQSRSFACVVGAAAVTWFGSSRALYLLSAAYGSTRPRSASSVRICRVAVAPCRDFTLKQRCTGTTLRSEGHRLPQILFVSFSHGGRFLGLAGVEHRFAAAGDAEGGTAAEPGRRSSSWGGSIQAAVASSRPS